MKQIILTLDYELFGNGSGDVFEHIIIPTEKILSIARKYGAKLTIFFEVIEYWRLKEEWEKGNRMGYERNPITIMEHQIKAAAKDGHDIQLHLHPQWVDAQWINNGWNVNFDDWRLGGYNKVGDCSLDNLFLNGKETLENLIRPVNPNYRCHAIRAGGYCVQPSDEIVRVMHKYNFDTDSSIYPEGLETGSRQFFDFRGLPKDRGFWYCGCTLEAISKEVSDIREFPIVGLNIIRLRKFLSMERIKGLIGNRSNATEALAAKTSTISDGEIKKAGLLDKVAFFFKHECQTWDYCLLSKSLHRGFLKKIEKQKNRNHFVLVGHPKSLLSDGKNMDWLLKQLMNQGFEFSTISDVQLT